MKVLREREGLEPDDTSMDAQLNELTSFEALEELATWNLGHSGWLDTFIQWPVDRDWETFITLFGYFIFIILSACLISVSWLVLTDPRRGFDHFKLTCKIVLADVRHQLRLLFFVVFQLPLYHLLLSSLVL